MNQRIYLVGAGAIAGYHAEAIDRHFRSAGQARPMLYVTDVNPDTLAGFAERFPWAKPVRDVDAMLGGPAREDDVVIVATPPSTHAAIACKALRSGRHVLCEKPLAMNREEAEAMLQAARAAGKLLGCCSSRFAGLPTSAKAREMLEQGRLGQAYQVQWIQRRQRARSGIEYQPHSRWFLNKSISGGGTLMDWGPYDVAGMTEVLQPVQVDVLHAWMTDPATGHPLAAESDVEQHAGALLMFRLPNGDRIPVHYERAACCHGPERSLTEIEGTAGAVSWDWLCLDGDGEWIMRGDADGEPTEERRLPANGTPGMMDKPILYFLEAVASRPSPAIVNEQAVFNFGILASIYECVRTGRPQTLTKETIL